MERSNKVDNSDMYVINKDYCPEKDDIIMQGQCTGCEYYLGFGMYLGQPCVKCSFYKKQVNTEGVNEA